MWAFDSGKFDSAKPGFRFCFPGRGRVYIAKNRTTLIMSKIVLRLSDYPLCAFC